MRSVAVVSVGGAPGVTTLVCAAASAAHERPILVIEACPTGGSIAARWRLGVHDAVTTTARLAMEVGGQVDLWEAAHHPWLSASRVIPAHPSAAVMRQAQVGRWLAEQLPESGWPTLLDLGRVDGSTDQLAVIEVVDELWVAIDPVLEQVASARAVRHWLDRTRHVGLLVREPAGDPARESATAVAETLGWPVVATVPEDRPAARALCGLAAPRRNLGRSPLLRTGRVLADRLADAEVPA